MIVFETVRFKNFKSYGNTFTEVRLDKSPTTAITAANGHGKSTILHSIEFALFGKVSANINKPDLINNVNGKDCVVEIEFQTKNRKFIVKRGMRPAIFEIWDGEKLINQTADGRDYQKFLEEEILGFNLFSFKQVVTVSGSSFTPFMLLATGFRRKITDDLLGLTVISTMNKLLKLEIDKHQKTIDEVERAMMGCENRIRGLKEGLKKLQERDASDLEHIDTQISDTQIKIDALLSEVEELNTKLKGQMSLKTELQKVEKQSNELDSFERDIKNQIRALETSITNISNLDQCPTCSREVDTEFKAEFAKDRSEKVEVRKNALDKLEQKRIKLLKALEDLRAKLEVFSNLEREIIVRNTRVSELNKNISQLNKRRSNGTGSDKELEGQIREVDGVLQNLKSKKLDLLVGSQYNDIQLAVIKDSGIRATIIKRFIPKINALVNKYLGLMDLNVSFSFDENFKETILSRFRDDLSYTAFSAGERARMDIAVLMAWRDIARTRNSLKCNLFFLDETFDAFLDSSGLEAFVNLLTNLEGTNVFLISHRPEIVDKFQSNLRISKVGNFSRIE